MTSHGVRGPPAGRPLRGGRVSESLVDTWRPSGAHNPDNAPNYAVPAININMTKTQYTTSSGARSKLQWAAVNDFFFFTVTMKFVPLLRLFLLLSALCSLGTSLRVDITDAHNGGTPSTIDTGVRDLHSTQSIVDVQKSISPFCPPMFRHQAAISHYSF